VDLSSWPLLDARPRNSLAMFTVPQKRPYCAFLGLLARVLQCDPNESVERQADSRYAR
jgi:hypothetical protein